MGDRSGTPLGAASFFDFFDALPNFGNYRPVRTFIVVTVAILAQGTTSAPMRIAGPFLRFETRIWPLLNGQCKAIAAPKGVTNGPFETPEARLIIRQHIWPDKRGKVSQSSRLQNRTNFGHYRPSKLACGLPKTGIFG